MSKPKMVVLAFLNREPMYGYQIGHVAEEFGLPVWASIKLPSIYKALQDLETSQHISGEQVAEGNTPPRTVFHINAKGKKLLFQLLQQNLSTPVNSSNDWWLALSLSWHAVTREFLTTSIQARLDRLRQAGLKAENSPCRKQLALAKLPFVHQHILRMGQRHHRAEIKSLKELLEDVVSGRHDDYFLSDKGE